MSDFAAIKIAGLRDLNRELKALDPAAGKQIKAALNDAAEIVLAYAKPRVPSATGAARSSIMVRSTVRESRVVAGGKRAPYYPWLDYGGKVGRNKSVKRPFIKEGRYLYPALGARKTEFSAMLETRLTAIITDAGLTPDRAS